MNIAQAYRQLTSLAFVNWALKNKYPYFIKIEGSQESGWIYPKKGSKKYKFNHKNQ